MVFFKVTTYLKIDTTGIQLKTTKCDANGYSWIFTLLTSLKVLQRLYIFFPKSTPDLIDSSMSRYLNFSTQVVNFPPGQVQTNAVWIVHPGKKGQLYRSRDLLRLNDEIKCLHDNNVKVNSRQVGECFYDFMSPHKRNGRQFEWASGKFHPSDSFYHIVTCRRVTHPSADRARRCLTSERSRASQPHH